MHAKLNAVKLGLAGAILWGVSLFFLTWLSRFSGYGMFWLSQFIDIYPGYDITIPGAFLGLFWGFIDGFVCLFLLGWLYNLLKP